MGIAMFLNVWLVIWPQQQVVIGNARNLLAGGEANPNAAAAARAGAMASRQNTIFSFPVLFFMVGAGHFFLLPPNFNAYIGTGKTVMYLLIGLVVLAVLELNALGKISGRGNTGLNVIYETHKNAMYAGFGIIVVIYILAEIISPRTDVRFSDAELFGDAGAVGIARAEQRLARLHALHVEVHVVLPRVADAAVDLDALLGEQALAVAGRGLGDRRRRRCAGGRPRRS